MKGTEYKPFNMKKTLARMKWWAKEKERRAKAQKKFHEKLFRPLIEKMLGKEK